LLGLPEDGIEELQATSVRGSGGPILGIRKWKDNQSEYAGIAVQGSWSRERRMVFGTPMAIVVGIIEDLLDKSVAAKGADVPRQ
jgi:hypothetical protein